MNQEKIILNVKQGKMNELMQYLATKPFGEVINFVEVVKPEDIPKPKVEAPKEEVKEEKK